MYIRCLFAAVVVMVFVSMAALYVNDERLRSDDTAMRTTIAIALRQVTCAGIGDQDVCAIARFNAATPARRALAGVVSRLPDDLVNALASTPQLDQWLYWMIKQVTESAASQSAAGSHKAGKSRDAQ